MLEIRNLDVKFTLNNNIIHAVKGISYDLHPGQSIGIVGESGSGKSVSSMAIMGLLPASAEVKGEIIFKGQPLLNLSENDYRQIRGRRLVISFKIHWLH